MLPKDQVLLLFTVVTGIASLIALLLSVLDYIQRGIYKKTVITLILLLISSIFLFNYLKTDNKDDNSDKPVITENNTPSIHQSNTPVIATPSSTIKNTATSKKSKQTPIPKKPTGGIKDVKKPDNQVLLDNAQKLIDNSSVLIKDFGIKDLTLKGGIIHEAMYVDVINTCNSTWRLDTMVGGNLDLDNDLVKVSAEFYINDEWAGGMGVSQNDGYNDNYVYPNGKYTFFNGTKIPKGSEVHLKVILKAMVVVTVNNKVIGLKEKTLGTVDGLITVQ